jgi:hypothetical protein
LPDGLHLLFFVELSSFHVLTMNSTDPRIIAFAGPPPSDIGLNANTASSDRAAIIAVLILALLAISLRFVARSIQRTKIHWDDWVIILSMVLVAGTAGLAIAGKIFIQLLTSPVRLAHML